MWLASCRRQGMLPQGPTPDRKCKLNISLFLILPHLSNCFICTKNSVSIVLFYKWWGKWIGGGSGGWFISECGWGDRGWLLSHKGFFTCDFIFCCLMPCLFFFKWLEHDSCLSVSVFIICFLPLVPLTKSYCGIEIVVLVMWNYL